MGVMTIETPEELLTQRAWFKERKLPTFGFVRKWDMPRNGSFMYILIVHRIGVPCSQTNAFVSSWGARWRISTAMQVAGSFQLGKIQGLCLDHHGWGAKTHGWGENPQFPRLPWLWPWECQFPKNHQVHLSGGSWNRQEDVMGAMGYWANPKDNNFWCLEFAAFLRLGTSKSKQLSRVSVGSLQRIERVFAQEWVHVNMS